VLNSNTAALMLAQRAPGETAFGCVYLPTNQPEDDRDDVAASKTFCMAGVGICPHFLLDRFRSKIAAFLEWAWEWLTYARGARLIIGSAGAHRRRSAAITIISGRLPRAAAPPKS